MIKVEFNKLNKRAYSINKYCMNLKSVYIVNMKGTTYYKIGNSENVENRIKQLQTSNPMDIILIISYKCKRSELLEKTLHEIYKDKKIRGEWFIFNEDELNKCKETAEKLSEEIKKNSRRYKNNDTLKLKQKYEQKKTENKSTEKQPICKTEEEIQKYISDRIKQIDFYYSQGVDVKGLYKNDPHPIIRDYLNNIDKHDHDSKIEDKTVINVDRIFQEKFGHSKKPDNYIDKMFKEKFNKL